METYGTKNFSLAGDPKLACSCGCGFKVRQSTLERAQALREALGFPLQVTSGGRCPTYNQKVSGTGPNGPHTTGGAIDFGVSGQKARILVKKAIELGFSGIGVSQKGPHEKRFIHVDDLDDAPGQPRPWIWSY